MSENHAHYLPANLPPSIKAKLDAGERLSGPLFVGQGFTHSVGSDSYGGYVVSIATLPNRKPIVGLVSADSVMHGDWTEGTMDNSVDLAQAKPEQWITTYGKNKITGAPKWWFCSATGDRKNPVGYRIGKCGYSWNGAYSYRDPSF